jgi:hypothetical protein
MLLVALPLPRGAAVGAARLRVPTGSADFVSEGLAALEALQFDLHTYSIH